ncbi:MAG: glycoside hydrolase family 2 TIM barrel-domain containing protein [Acidobacteriota bacterium]
MHRLSLLVFLWLPAALPTQAQVLFHNPEGTSTHRHVTSLDGLWRTIVDPYENGYYDYRYQPHAHGYFKDAKPPDPSALQEYDFDTSPTLQVPGDWNSQRRELLLYEGTVWYRRQFEYPKLAEGRRLFVHFGAANYEARVYLNGSHLGLHTGGFTPFGFELTDRVRAGKNSLVVKVDATRHREGVPTVNTDWWNYGGLTRRVRLIEVPDTYIQDYFLHWDDAGTVAGWVQLDGPDLEREVTVRIPAVGVETQIRSDASGRAQLRLAADLALWTPDHPKVYDVELTTDSDSLVEKMGFRRIETRGDEILLNGESVFLRGISIHEEAPGGGRAFTVDHARTLLGWAKQLGCNFVRLAHYPHNEFMVREAERMGLMVWAEVPVYWTIQWQNAATYELAEQQLSEMIQRDRNRASVVIWSVANETPRSAPRLEFLKGLIDEARRLDPTRLISAATEISWQEGGEAHLDDPLGKHLDVLGVNEYVGWYGGVPEDAQQLVWSSSHDKPLIISEFGAGALAGHHGDEDQRWTEEYQARLYREQIKMLRRIDFLRGISPWILMDFRSPRRPLPGIQDFWNRKGLVSERGQHKAAFSVLQAFYEELAQSESP